ncbi:MAG: zinc ribbon domain-containing protein [Chloroflexota bacterium]
MAGSQEPPDERHGVGTYQMLWDCKFCGTQKLLGVTHRHCPNCGAAQDPEQRYFPAEEDMVALEDHPYVGADKICPACQQPNSAASTYCTECGADLATGVVAPTQGVREIGTGRAETDTRRDVVKDKFDAEMAHVGVSRPPGRKVLGLSAGAWLAIAVVALLAICIGGAIYALTYRTSAEGTVSALGWERTIAIESFQAVPGSAWEDDVPGDAYGISCKREQRGTRQVPDGSHEECRDTDQGDGSFRRECRTVQDYRDEPVYDNWCKFTVNRWAYAREVTASGTGDDPPAWPTYTLALGTGTLGRERAGAQREQYTVVLRLEDGDEQTCRFDDEADWAQYRAGMAVSLKLDITGDADCATLKPAG